jgi:acyl carrier protein
MMQQETYAKLTGVFRDVFDDDSLVIGPETTAADVPGWDSQAHISLVVATEMLFGIRFRTSELEGLHNVADFVKLIDTKRPGA